ncbi:MAG TPA: hypothetical protein VF487_21280 [Chitinophagaceae bacterium]
MTTEVLNKKTTRYLQGRAMPAETRQIQTWLSCTDNSKRELKEEEKLAIESEILAEIQAYTAYPLFYPRPEPWWKRITAFF